MERFPKPLFLRLDQSSKHLGLWTGGLLVLTSTRRAQHQVLPITSSRTIRGLCLDPRRGNLFP